MGITDKSRQQAQQKRLDRQQIKNNIKQQEKENSKKLKVPTEQQLEQLEAAKETFEETGLNEHWEYYQRLSVKFYGR